MAQITTTDANEFSSSAEFIPMRGFSNCHLQTMLPRLFRRQVKFTPYWQRLELPDGDFVDLRGVKTLHRRNINLVWWCFTGWKAVSTALTPTVWLRRRKSAAGWAW